MSCCPGIRCKNTGSGYVKPDCDSATSKELDKRMEEMLKARSLQDAGIFAPVRSATATATATASELKGNLNGGNNQKPGGR